MKVSIGVIGSGPAGAAAALTLRRYVPDLTVALVAPDAKRTSIGEALSPGAFPLLQYLDLGDLFRNEGHRIASGMASAWGMPDVQVRSNLFSGWGHGWHLDRGQFDTWLFTHAVAAGTVPVRGSVRRQNLSREERRWLITTSDGAELEAKVLIDATGRGSLIARSTNAKIARDDTLVATVRHYHLGGQNPELTEALVEAVPDGWWYSARIADARGIAMFMTDGDLLRREAWAARLASAHRTAERMAHWVPDGETVVRPANSQKLTQITGPGWVAAGDAAVAFDPLSSLGIGFALSSGIEAARVAVEMLEGADDLAQAYNNSVQGIYDDYRARLSALYRAEQRWPDSGFWARRLARGTP